RSRSRPGPGRVAARWVSRSRYLRSGGLHCPQSSCCMTTTVANALPSSKQVSCRSPVGERYARGDSKVELLSGAEMVVRSLRDEGVKVIYGYPGGAVLHVYHAMFRHADGIHVMVRHEQASAHMADGYARATGKPGVVLVTSGPGATNTITGIATAYMDSIPMVIISGQVASHLVGTDAFQETDMVGISRPIVK